MCVRVGEKKRERQCVREIIEIARAPLSMQVESGVLVPVRARGPRCKRARCQEKFIFYRKDGDIFTGLEESPITNINVPIYRSP